MRFHKMHGLGNDFIVVDGTSVPVENPAETARRLCRRRTGIGSDGLIVIGRSDSCDFRMDFYNPDGSPAICGNGLRCLGKFVYETGLTGKKAIVVDTVAGPRRLRLEVADGAVESVSVDMDAPSFRRGDIPMKGPDGEVVDEPLTVGGDTYRVTCLSLGNPHCVIFTAGLDEFPLGRVGPAIENHAVFPQRTNVEFVEVTDRRNVRLRIWERGVGETMASGTGSTAAAVASIKRDLADSPVRVNLALGSIEIDWRPGAQARMTGPATYVFGGEVPDGTGVRDDGPNKGGAR